MLSRLGVAPASTYGVTDRLPQGLCLLFCLLSSKGLAMLIHLLFFYKVKKKVRVGRSAMSYFGCSWIQLFYYFLYSTPMLKTSPKQERIRHLLSNKNYLFFIYKLIKLFLVKQYSYQRTIYWFNTLTLYSSFKFGSKTRGVCLLTGRSRSVYRLFRLSRLMIRTYSKCGYFTGLSKASW